MAINFRIAGSNSSLINPMVRIAGVNRNINHIFQKDSVNGNKTIWQRVGLNPWTARSMTTGMGSLQDVCYGNGYWMIVSNTTGSGSGSGRMAYSIDNGANWIQQNWTATGTRNWSALTYSPALNLFCVVADGNSGGTRCVTVLGNSIASATNRTIPTAAWCDICWGNGMFIAVSNTTTYATSPDGITWTSRTLPYAGSSICWCEGLKLFCISGGYLMTSTNGTTWTVRDTNISRPLVRAGNDRFIAMRSGALNIYVSLDGITWTQYSAPHTMSDICYNPDKQMFVSVDGVSAYPGTAFSQDGIIWTTQTSIAESSNWTSIAYGNNTFISVASSPTTAANRVMTTTAA